jgi:hypothetical protein
VPLLALASPAGDPAGDPANEPFDSGRAGFLIRTEEVEIPYRVLGLFVLPGERLPLAVQDPDDAASYRLEASGGGLSERGSGTWEWTAPEETGLHPLRIVHQPSGETMLLNAFVMVPATEVSGGMLNGYRIGEYPAEPLRGRRIYLPPRGFVEVTPGNIDTPVSPHFTLGQFLCKQGSGFPKYLVLAEKLLLKLEIVLETANEVGHRADTFHVMSGYRTPHYNEAIGNVAYSRHLWGDAADIFLDVNPRDGTMDDLDGDGKTDLQDAAVLYRLIDDLYGKKGFGPYFGGLGQYRATSSHGPFVHIDTRGYHARW